MQGGGASLPAKLYKGTPTSILPATFSYAVTGSGTGKKAFLENNAGLFSTTGTVHFAGSDSVLEQAEIDAYATNFAPTFGPLIQAPVVGTSVTVPFNSTGGDLDLSVTQLCGVFSGKITQWNQLDSNRSGAITVVYRNEKSGTTELLTRFLASACSASDTAGTNLVGGKFTTTQEFWKQFSTLPTNFTTASALGSQPLYDKVYATAGAVGYIGPDVVPNLSDATKIAKVRGFSPNDPSVQATLDTASVPTGDAAKDPKNWVPVFTDPPSVGYPIVGYTNFVLGQCYKTAAAANALRTFLLGHYNGNNDAASKSHGFVPLTPAWRDAIRTRFVVAGSTAGLNNPSTCAGLGRP
ncbi:MAG: Alkaline phosphatase L [Stenotrophomonas maltophilia]|uniref:Phosphate-binding protein PstS n=1 Tax=Stenotrophomonas maltophilia TaxID=40324 RepID=A0A7V8JN18_STEMA|nr:MAG: Alkaline phosphatase L [Stenotrophomonas maltophilia]